MVKKLDKETKAVLDEGSELQSLVASDGWKIARARLRDNVLSIGNIMAITGDDPTKIMAQLAARQIAVETILNWVNDIEGSAAQFKSHAEQFATMERESAILILDEEIA